MKLIFCPKCQDLFKLSKEFKACNCGESFGNYLEDGLIAQIGGSAVPVGIDNNSFIQAYKQRPVKGNGSRFEAFVIPVTCPTIKKIIDEI